MDISWPVASQPANSSTHYCAQHGLDVIFSAGWRFGKGFLWCREAARRTRAKRMDTIASLSNEVQLLASMNQGLTLQLQQAVYQVCKRANMPSVGLC